MATIGQKAACPPMSWNVYLIELRMFWSMELSWLITISLPRLNVVSSTVREGTCGGLGNGMAMGDTVIATPATCDDTTPLRYVQMASYSPTATHDLVSRAVEQSRLAGGTVHVGPIVTAGLFYDSDDTAFARWQRSGHLAVEMEAAMMYTVAAVHRLEALAMMTVSDVLGDDGSAVRIDDDELRRGVDDMMRIACAVAVS